MTYKNFTFDIDADGIALVTWDMPDRSMNVMTPESFGELTELVETVAEDDAIKGCIITSGKDTFSGGADISMLAGFLKTYEKNLKKGDEVAAVQELHDTGNILSKLARRIETCGTPFVAALNGTTMGGAFELALGCHYRISIRDKSIRIGLPESRIGLLPGGGGTQRVARLIGAQDALQMMLQGRTFDPIRAKGMKLIHALADSREEMIAEAKKWINDGGKAIAPWDMDGFRIPGGQVYSKAGVMTWSAGNAIYRRETYDNYPAARAIMSCVYEGLQVPMDVGLRIEARYFTSLMRGNVARNMIRTLFLSMQELNKGARRPAGVPEYKVRKLGILGAGMMGAGIAYVSARAGMEVVLLDQSVQAAERGKAYSETLLDKAISRGRSTAEKKQALLDNITPTDDYDALKGCDLIIEAVFENRDIKAEVTKKAEAQIADTAVFGSNTSTLPITGLARASARPENFIGIHFFSPVDKMMLVEIILGEKTGPETLAKTLDYVRAIRKTPIVVNDSRGFYTSRVVSTYIDEGLTMLSEGIPAAMVENVGRMAGMPIGPLSLNDEVSLDLAHKIATAARKDLGDKYIEVPRDKILDEMVVKRDRLGRKNSRGFYDYPENGKKHLWPDLHTILPDTVDPDTIDVEELKHRFWTIQALETARCFEESVLTDVRDADVGAILGWGFAPFTGGPLSYIDTMGAQAFVVRCQALEKKHGSRFKPGRLLKEMAGKGETFYSRFNPKPDEGVT